MTRILHRSLLALAVMMTLSAGLWALRAAPAHADERPHATGSDLLVVAHHAEASIVTVRSRTPVPGTAAAQHTDAFGIVAAASTLARDGGTPHRGTPLYALFGVYRL